MPLEIQHPVTQNLKEMMEQNENTYSKDIK